MSDLRKVKYTTEFDILQGKSYPHEGFFHKFCSKSHEVCNANGTLIYIDVPSAIIEGLDGKIKVVKAVYIKFEDDAAKLRG